MRAPTAPRPCVCRASAPRFGTPLVLKPLDGYGSRGVKLVEDAKAADALLDLRRGP
jgi:biotin carboxylase